MKTTSIQQKYFDAIFFASASQNEKKDFSITPAQFKVLLKLIHYSTNDKYITWTSENISKHICAPISSIDKSIQRLKQKGYIKVTNTQESRTHKTRTIQIIWDKIQSIDDLYNEWLLEIQSIESIIDVTEEETELDFTEEETTQLDLTEEEIVKEEVIQPKETELNKLKLLKYVDNLVDSGRLNKNNTQDLYHMINNEEITTITEIDEQILYYI